jgi:hypothetical protein
MAPRPGETQTMIFWASLQRNSGSCGLCEQALPCREEGDALHYSQGINPVLERVIIATVSKFLVSFTL